MYTWCASKYLEIMQDHHAGSDYIGRAFIFFNLSQFPLRTKSLSLNKKRSSELVFLIIKLSSDDIIHINFYLFGRLLKFVFTFLILLIIWVLLFSKTGH
jgi:hypothetical protein